MPPKLLNEAESFAPFANPEDPDPANVVTFPDASILRIRLFVLSRIYILPFLSIVILPGEENLACIGVPSTYPGATLPAKVVTRYVGIALDTIAGE